MFFIDSFDIFHETYILVYLGVWIKSYTRGIKRFAEYQSATKD